MAYIKKTAPKYIKQKLTELKWKTAKSTTTVDFNRPFTVTDKASSQISFQIFLSRNKKSEKINPKVETGAKKNF